MSDARHELFHRLADVASAEVRKLIVDAGIRDEVDFRNIDVSETALAELRLLSGGDTPPALKLKDGTLLRGVEEVRGWIAKRRG